ncbi:MAG TPA: SGNH/GDSL hydrolase family protein [Sphingomonas sp.]|nr:SGNH/GDSL hydrolase family protein [Sphingomonas sp.]
MRTIPALLATAIAFGLAGAAPAAPQDRWIAAWTAPPIGYEPTIRDALGRPFQNETTRQTVRAGVAGAQLRVRLTNELSDTPLTIGAASIATLDASGAVVPGSIRPLTFGGAKGVTIPAHAPYLSDPVAMPVAAGETLAVSIHYPGEAAPPAHAQMLDVAPGDATAVAAWADAKHVRAPGLVSGLQVSGAAQPRVLVAFGDSITEGAGATPGKAMSWPSQLGRMLAARPEGECWSVVNAGISGNRLLHDGRGPDALSRFDRDVLSVPGVTHVVLLEGINDMGKISDPARADQAVTADQVIGAYRQLIARAHARGVKVIVGTLLPYQGAGYYSEEGEQKRLAANAWIRANASHFDGLIDFDKAMQEPGKPLVMRLAEQIGDHLHPNDAGYTRMAQTALPEVLKDRCPAR